MRKRRRIIAYDSHFNIFDHFQRVYSNSAYKWFVKTSKKRRELDLALQRVPIESEEKLESERSLVSAARIYVPCTTRTFRIESPAFVFLYLISLSFPAAEMQCLFVIINRKLAEYNLALLEWYKSQSLISYPLNKLLRFLTLLSDCCISPAFLKDRATFLRRKNRTWTLKISNY